MPYDISAYTKKQAIKLGVQVKPSTNKKKKIDVFKNENKVASVGAVGYGDYPSFISSRGKKYADERRRLYKIRHAGDRSVIGSNGYYADKLLW